MRLTKVTITGADDSISQRDIMKLSRKFPFVEWGILVSRSSAGKNRFPSVDWMEELYRLIKLENASISLSGHLCGAYVREILLGKTSFCYEVGNLWRSFQRIQINTHGVTHEWTEAGLDRSMNEFESKEFIFQLDGANNSVVEFAKMYMDVNGLFDMSHGAGVLPGTWPQPLMGMNCGYAGGMSPTNVEENIQKIEKLGGNQEFWIDMETHVRTNHDSQFDLGKVEKVLQISSKYVV